MSPIGCWFFVAVFTDVCFSSFVWAFYIICLVFLLVVVYNTSSKYMRNCKFSSSCACVSSTFVKFSCVKIVSALSLFGKKFFGWRTNSSCKCNCISGTNVDPMGCPGRLKCHGGETPCAVDSELVQHSFSEAASVSGSVVYLVPMLCTLVKHFWKGEVGERRFVKFRS